MAKPIRYLTCAKCKKVGRFATNVDVIKVVSREEKSVMCKCFTCANTFMSRSNTAWELAERKGLI